MFKKKVWSEVKKGDRKGRLDFVEEKVVIENLKRALGGQ